MCDRLGNSRGSYFTIVELHCHFINSNLGHFAEFPFEFLNQFGVEKVREKGLDALSMRRRRGVIEQRIIKIRQKGGRTIDSLRSPIVPGVNHCLATSSLWLKWVRKWDMAGQASYHEIHNDLSLTACQRSPSGSAVNDDPKNEHFMALSQISPLFAHSLVTS